MQTNSIRIAAYSVSFFFIGILFTSCLLNLGGDFFKITLKDAVELTIYIVFGVFVSYYITTKSNDNQKAKEQAETLVLKIDKTIEEIEGIISSQQRSIETRKELLLKIRKSSNILTSTLETYQQIKKPTTHLEEVKKQLLNLKQNITDNRWTMSDSWDIPEASISNAKKNITNIQSRLIKAQSDLFQ